MQQKMLLFGSFSAMLLGAVMLIMPAPASASSGCSSKGCEQIAGHVQFASCQTVVGGGCACPFPHPSFNGCAL